MATQKGMFQYFQKNITNDFALWFQIVWFSFPKDTTQSVHGHRKGCQGGLVPPGFWNYWQKKVIFQFRGVKSKTKFHHFWPPPGKSFGKISYWPPPGKNPSDAHDSEQSEEWMHSKPNRWSIQRRGQDSPSLTKCVSLFRRPKRDLGLLRRRFTQTSLDVVTIEDCFEPLSLFSTTLLSNLGWFQHGNSVEKICRLQLKSISCFAQYLIFVISYSVAIVVTTFCNWQIPIVLRNKKIKVFS